MKVQGFGVRGLWFRIWGLGFWGLWFRLWVFWGLEVSRFGALVPGVVNSCSDPGKIEPETVVEWMESCHQWV